MHNFRSFFMILFIFFPCIYTGEKINKVNESLNIAESADDSFLVELIAMAQDDSLDEQDQNFDILIDALVSERNEAPCNNFLYTYLAPYYCSLLVWYARIKDSINQYL